MLQRLSNGSNGCRTAVRGCSHLTAIGELQPSLAAGMKMGLHICILIGLYLQVLSFLVLARWREWLSLLFEWGSDRVGGTEVGGRLGGGATARGARCTVVVAEVMGLFLTPPPCYPHHRCLFIVTCGWPVLGSGMNPGTKVGDGHSWRTLPRPTCALRDRL